MEILRRIFATIWKIWFVLWFILVVLLSWPFFAFYLSNKKRYRRAYSLSRTVSLLITAGGGIFIRKIYRTQKEALPRAAIYVANHSSYIDIIASYIIIPNITVFMGKAELLKVPYIKMFFRDMNVAVNRKSRIDSHRALVKISQKLDEGYSVYIFPEGTIASDGKLLKFKNGAFKLAIDKQVPIVPIVYTCNWKLLQNGGFFKSYGRPGISYAVMHPPIETKGMTDENIVTLRDKVQHIFESTLEEFGELKK